MRPWGQGLHIVNEAKKIVERGVGTKIVHLANGDIRNITLKVILESAKQNDEIAIDLIRTAGLNLGVRIAYLMHLFEPEVVVVGGGIEAAGDLFLNPLKTSIHRFILQRLSDIEQEK